MANSMKRGLPIGRLLSPFHVGKDLPARESWPQLFGKWVWALNHYLQGESDTDLPHWQNDERSHTGFLAAAVWLLGGYAVEQFSTTRAADNSNDTGAGFCDLYFALPAFNLRGVIEAKIHWPATAEKTCQTQILDRLKEAEGQLSRMAPEDRKGVNVCLAGCWVVPELNRNNPSSDSEESLLRGLAASFLGRDTIVAIYYVPQEFRGKCEKRLSERRNYPGSIFVGKLWRA